jgi:hypothetical protein
MFIGYYQKNGDGNTLTVSETKEFDLPPTNIHYPNDALVDP